MKSTGWKKTYFLIENHEKGRQKDSRLDDITRFIAILSKAEEFAKAL